MCIYVCVGVFTLSVYMCMCVCVYAMFVRVLNVCQLLVKGDGVFDEFFAASCRCRNRFLEGKPM